jgi:hypothetical protein
MNLEQLKKDVAEHSQVVAGLQVQVTALPVGGDRMWNILSIVGR